MLDDQTDLGLISCRLAIPEIRRHTNTSQHGYEEPAKTHRVLGANEVGNMITTGKDYLYE